MRTREVGEEELRIIKELNLQDVEAFQQKLFWPVLKAMQVGVRVDAIRKAQLRRELQTEIDSRKRFLTTVLGNEINLASPPQMKDLFYRRLSQPPVMSRPKRGVVPHITCDDEALQTIAKREPLLKPIVNCIADIRTLQVLVSTFIEATVDDDGRMRSSFNIAEAMLVYASLDGVTQGFIVTKGTAGLSISEEREKLMGLNALPMYRVKLENVAASRLGGASGHNFELILSAMRIASASAAVGVARSSFEYARNYAKEREAFGVKIAQKQAIAFFLAAMATEMEAIRLLTWEAAWKLDNNKDDAHTTAYLAPAGAADMGMMVTDRGVQIYGGHGYIRENPVELLLRNGRGFASLLGLVII